MKRVIYLTALTLEKPLLGTRLSGSSCFGKRASHALPYDVVHGVPRDLEQPTRKTAAAAEAPKKKPGNEGPADTAVTILEKPKPDYTAEGRSMRLEGDVTLDVIFLASGHVQVNRVVNGLGHGLDESASKAAQQIKFKPALREGQPVDYPARVRIEFRLAY